MAKTKYQPRFVEQIVNWFQKYPLTRTIKKTVASAGRAVEVIETVAAEFPMIEDWARERGVSTQTIKKWAEKYPEFAESLEFCRDIQRQHLIKHGLTSQHSPSLVQFILKNQHGFFDKLEAKVEGNMNMVFKIVPYGTETGEISAPESKGDEWLE